ncbi:MAG: DUF5696 domain-containing protein, partial [Oscillospiraceae bacterium]|jgi:hypothetical protein|nr:DUF5696 domain-containing protein [Oscillospiraceae bacterium]
LSFTKTVRDPEGPLPLQLTLLGTGRNARGGVQTLTTSKQAQDILSRLKNKGVNSVNARYQGVFGGGTKQVAPEKLRPLLRLGGTRGIEDLRAFSKSQGYYVFLDVQALPAGGKAGQSINLAGAPLQAVIPHAAQGGLRTLRSAESVNLSVRAFLRRLAGMGTAGISLGDLGNMLYTSYNAESAPNREATAKRLAQYLPCLSAQWFVMMDTGYFYSIRSADAVVNLPLEPQVTMPTPGRYMPVPLLPIILHGSVDYSGPALNQSDNSATALLRAIAYGASPAYVWAANSNDAEKDPLYFENGLESAVLAYTKINETLAGLHGERIVGYSYDLDTSVSVTTYSNDAVVYVNFGKKEVSVKGVKIIPGDCRVVGGNQPEAQ